MPGALAIRRGTVLAWMDGAHRVLPRATVLVEGNAITYVGDGPVQADREIDATGRLVVPGLINLHSHATDTAFTRDFLEESTGPKDYANLYRVLPAVRNAITARDACIGARSMFIEMLLAGTTTVVEMGYDRELAGSTSIDNAREVAEIAVGLGLRCYTAPRYRRGYWRGDASGNVGYYDYADAGRARMEECIACRAMNGRHGTVRDAAPGQVDTATRDAHETRRAANKPTADTMHAGHHRPSSARSRGHGMTTIRHLERSGLLGRSLVTDVLAETNDVSAIASEDLAPLRTRAARSASAVGKDARHADELLREIPALSERRAWHRHASRGHDPRMRVAATQ